MVRFRSAHLSDPHDLEARLSPAAADFDGVTGLGEEAHAVETRAILAEVHSVGALRERITLAS